MLKPLLLFFAALLLTASSLFAQEPPYEQEEDHVYATINGQDFYMDIFRPKTTGSNGLGIVDIASGYWFSDRGKINDHKKAKFFDVLTAHGYTVFAVRPGTRGKFQILDMVDHIRRAIRYIKANAETYHIDPDRLGITGPSAGGHLATYVALTPQPGDPQAEDPLLRQSTEVKAAGIFFPPTDFLHWNGNFNAHEQLADLYFPGGLKDKTPAEIEERARQISPRYQVTENAPPFLIFHGDADPLVPLQQSEVLVEALKEKGNKVTLVVVPGGEHPWPDIDREVGKMADWFDQVLAGKPAKAPEQESGNP